MYQILFNGCECSYFGGSAKSLDIGLQDHGVEVKHCCHTGVLVVHTDKKCLLMYSDAKVLESGLCIKEKKSMEA